MPYAKGQSGNPTGRPKVNSEIKALVLKNTVPAVKCILEIMRTAEDDKTRLAAAIEILNRAYGKPSQSVEVSGETRTYVIAVPIKTDMEGIAWESQYNPAQKTLSQ